MQKFTTLSENMKSFTHSIWCFCLSRKYTTYKINKFKQKSNFYNSFLLHALLMLLASKMKGPNSINNRKFMAQKYDMVDNKIIFLSISVHFG